MSGLAAVAYYEYRMAVSRWGVWLAFGLASLPVLSDLPRMAGLMAQSPLAEAGELVLALNCLLPLVAGVVIADRLPRDRQLRLRELLRSSPLSRPAYVLGKYTGAVLATLTPVAVILLGSMAYCLACGLSISLLGAVLAAFLSITVPTYLFVGAFSLACPAVLPVRGYQVLFVGYWFWANFLTPKVMPTVNGTLLESVGTYAATAFFHARSSMTREPRTVVEAVLNLAILLTCAALALLALERYLAWQERSA